MRGKIWAGSALISSSLASVVATSAAAADPAITPGPNYELFRRQNNDRFMGWVEFDGTWSSQNCDVGVTYFQSASHWRCCATSSAGCDIPKACVSGNLIYDGSVLGSTGSLTFPCTSVYDDPSMRSFTVCNTAYMYQNEQDSNPETNVNCGVSSLNWSYYRVQPEAAKTTSTPTQPRSTASATQTDGTSDGDVSAPTHTSAASKKKKSSKAWIAGPAIGAAVALALIGFLVRFFKNKKKSKDAVAVAPPATHAPDSAPPAGPSSPPQYYPPPMQQQGAGMVPFGVADGKQNTWAHQPQSPVSQPSSPNPTSMYGNQYPQQGGHAGPGQPVYNAPSPSMSPQPQQGGYAENSANYPQVHAHEARPFSSELDGSPQIVSVQPKTN